LRILIITSCTGEKRVKDPHGLTPQDFRKGRKHIEARERELKALMSPAKNLYTGEQHIRLMRGIQALTAARPGTTVELRILSAGYGLISGERKIAPYEMTFNGMGKAELQAWSNELGIQGAIRAALAEPFDLGLLLLGEQYLAAANLSADLKVGGPLVAFCGKPSVPKLAAMAGVRPVQLANKDAKLFSCGMVGLKGELAKRILERIADGVGPQDVLGQVDLLSWIETPTAHKSKRSAARANPNVDKVIDIPQAWWDKPHRKKLRYFIPEWDDLVDPDYGFLTDTHSGGTGDWSNEVYAHQMYPEPNYDGILVSRAVAQKSKKKDARINEMGVHRFVRVPRNFPIMGDCGAFDYIEKKEPPYTTADVLEYYTRLDFDYGVSVDHLIVPAFYADKQFRYDLTIQNAEDFILEHRKQGLRWEPIGAAQGWDPKSYADAVAAYIKMGYRCIALGGLVRCSTKEIVGVLEDVSPRLKPGIQLHLFGIARPEALATFASLGVTSVDSASHLRRAWLVARDNYCTLDGNSYSAIRIPEVGKSFRTKRMVSEGKASEPELRDLAAKAMHAVVAVDEGKMKVGDAVRVIEAYDRLIGEDRDEMHEEYRRTLEAKPWKLCPCDICRKWGVQVMVFRGNNRNRRRGFHNTYVFYRLMQQSLLGGDPMSLAEPQLQLFQAKEVA
jgi:hypothetical protein